MHCMAIEASEIERCSLVMSADVTFPRTRVLIIRASYCFGGSLYRHASMGLTANPAMCSLDFRLWGLGESSQLVANPSEDSEFMVQGSGFRVSSLGFRV